MGMKPSEVSARWRDRCKRASADLLSGPRMREVLVRLNEASGGPVILSEGEKGPRALSQARRIGVFAGSFNPQTVAHAALGDAARVAARFDLVLWTLTRVTLDKERVARATLADRAMQLLSYCRAVAPDDAVLVLEAGLYADQAEAVRRLIGPDADLWLIVGFDKVIQIFDPRYYADRDAALRRLFAAAGLLVAPRAGQGEQELEALLARPENRIFAAGVRSLPVSELLAEVASTGARRLLRDESAPDGKVVTFDRLASVVTPEGAALGLATGAYQREELGEPISAEDRYAARMRWLDTLVSSS